MARGRPATPLGTHGEISFRQLPSGNIQASTWLRLLNGTTTRIRASGKSESAATRAVKESCKNALKSVNTPTLSTTSPMSALLDEWLKSKTEIRSQTKDRYENAIDNHIKPAMGKLRLNEVTALYLDGYLRSVTPGIGGNIRSVLKGAFKYALLHELIPTNPMLAVSAPVSGSVEVRALEVEEIPEFRATIKQSGDQLLIDVIDLCLSTGMRAGEVLGLSWDDVFLDDDVKLIRISGTMAYSKEHGYRKQKDGKTTRAKRPIQLSATAVKILERRKKEFGEHIPIVFPSRAGTPVWESNFNRSLQKHRGEKFSWVSIHSIRKTLATIVAYGLDPHKAADVLGHANSRMTEQVYIARTKRGVPIGEVVEDVVFGVQKVSK